MHTNRTTLICVTTGFCLLAVAGHVQALSCKPRSYTLAEIYAEADSIVVGLVTGCTEEVSPDSWANGGKDCAFQSIEVLKHSTPTRDYGGLASSHGCGLSLFVGQQYLLFLDRENKPLRYSTGVAHRHEAERTASYIRILRQHRDGVIDDLAEPWFFDENKHNCTLRHSVGPHNLRFSISKADVAGLADSQWQRESVDGKEVFRRTGGNGALTEITLAVTDDAPEFEPGAPTLVVSMREKEPQPRSALLTVGNRSWPLHSRTITTSFNGRVSNMLTMYVLGGNTVDDILQAAARPATIIVSAALTETESTHNVDDRPHGSRNAVHRTLATGIFQAEPPDPSQARVRTTINKRPQIPRELPEALLEFTTRSTQIQPALKRFQQCSKSLAR